MSCLRLNRLFSHRIATAPTLERRLRFERANLRQKANQIRSNGHLKRALFTPLPVSGSKAACRLLWIRNDFRDSRERKSSRLVIHRVSPVNLADENGIPNLRVYANKQIAPAESVGQLV